MLHKIISSVLVGLIFVAFTERVTSAQPAKKTPPSTITAQPTQIPQGQVKLTPPSKNEETRTTNVLPVSTGPFQVGEKLSFNVSWANFPSAARMEMEVAGQGSYFGRQGYQLKTKVQTVGSVRSMFREVDNQYTSYLDIKTLLPFRSDSTVRQGLKNEDDSIILDHQKKLVRYSDNSEVAIGAEALDLPSLIFSLRLRDFGSELKSKKISTLYGKQIIEVEVTAKQKERVSTQAGKFDAIRLELKAKTKDKGDFRVSVWFTDDKSKMPVLFVSKLSFGELRAELTQAMVKVPNKVNISPVDPKSGEIALNNASNIGIVLQRTDVTPSEFEAALPFSVGETINYDIAWANLGIIGKLTLNLLQRGILEDKVVMEMTAELSTIGAVRSVVNLNDTFKSYALANSLSPLKTETTIHEGKRNKQIIASYLSDSSVRLDNGTHFPVPDNTLDLVSLYYVIRASNLAIGKSQIYNFVDANHRLRSLNVKVIKKESINSAMGAREALQLDITNLETNQLMAQTWITNDAKRIPLYIVVRLSFGELRLSVKTVVNTK